MSERDTPQPSLEEHSDTPQPSLEDFKDELKLVEAWLEVVDANENLIERTRDREELIDFHDWLVTAIRMFSDQPDEQA